MTKELKINGQHIVNTFDEKSDLGEIFINGQKVLDYKTTADGKNLLHYEGNQSKIIELFVFLMVTKGREVVR